MVINFFKKMVIFWKWLFNDFLFKKGYFLKVKNYIIIVVLYYIMWGGGGFLLLLVGFYLVWVNVIFKNLVLYKDRIEVKIILKY